MTYARLSLAAAAALLAAAPISGQPAAAPAYADLADLAVVAQVAVDARIRSAARIDDAVGVRPGFQRWYVEAETSALIRGDAGLPARIAYVVDLPVDARGRAPKLKKRRVLVLARPVPGKPGQLQLVAPDAQLDWTPDADARLRAILAEAVAPGAAPRVTGVRSAFHTPGTIPGESETQIFLATARGDPVSISVVRRPGEIARWAVALGEIVDEAAGPPRPNTLLWYRLACGLPRTLSPAALAGQEPAQQDAARRDYQVVLEGLGACGRTRAS